MNLEWQGILFVFLFFLVTELDLPPSFSFLLHAHLLHEAKACLFACIRRSRGQQQELVIAKEGEKKRRREDKFTHRGKKEIKIKFHAILGSYVFLSFYTHPLSFS